MYINKTAILSLSGVKFSHFSLGESEKSRDDYRISLPVSQLLTGIRVTRILNKNSIFGPVSTKKVGKIAKKQS